MHLLPSEELWIEGVEEKRVSIQLEEREGF